MAESLYNKWVQEYQIQKIREELLRINRIEIENLIFGQICLKMTLVCGLVFAATIAGRYIMTCLRPLPSFLCRSYFFQYPIRQKNEFVRGMQVQESKQKFSVKV